jgi:hypothetical protein
MTQQWIVRVQGKEYGPVDLEELLEWKREGRLIRENEMREWESDRWFPAGELPEVFSDETKPPDIPPPLGRRRLALGEMFLQSLRLYRAGFGRFFALSLLVALPGFFFRLAAPFLEMPKPGEAATPVIISAAVAFLALVLLVIAWPFSIAGHQLLAGDLSNGQSPGLRELLGRAKPLWMRIFILGLMVYGSYLLWTVIPLVFGFSLVATATSSLSATFLALCLLSFAAYMVARLFINFLFWQPAGVLGGGDPAEALRESRALARSQTDRPRMERPLYRGALIASLWLVVMFAVDIAIELPVMLYQLRNVTSLEDAATAMQTLTSAKGLDLATIVTTLASSLAHAILGSWLAVFFVLLYLDTKAAVPSLPND